MYFETVVRQACKDKPGVRVFYRTKSGISGDGCLDGYGDDGMLLCVSGFSGVPSNRFVRFECLEEILFDDGSLPHTQDS